MALTRSVLARADLKVGPYDYDVLKVGPYDYDVLKVGSYDYDVC